MTIELRVVSADDWRFGDTGNAPIGIATRIPAADQSDRAELISMWVDPAVRSRGVATALITAIARWAAGTGAATLRLSVTPGNVPARRTYERNGFTVSDEPGGLLSGRQRELVMLRDLGIGYCDGYV